MSAESAQAMSCAVVKYARCFPLLALLMTVEIKESKELLGLDLETSRAVRRESYAGFVGFCLEKET